MKIFTPNTTLDNSTATLLVVSQAIVFLVLWVFNPFVFFPSLVDTASAFCDLWKNGLGIELLTSFTLNVQSILWASAISLGLAYAAVIPFFRPIVAFVSKLRFLSLVGLTFFFTLAAKNGHELKLYLLVFSVTVFFVTSMSDVLLAIPKVQFDLARSLRMGEWRVVWETVVLGQADKVFDVLRQNAAISWLMLSMVESMARGDGGIGALLSTQNKHFKLSAILAIQCTILTVGIFQDFAIGLLQRFFCPYAKLTLERK